MTARHIDNASDTDQSESAKRYLVSVIYQRWDEASKEIGICQNQGWLVDDSLMNAAQIQQLGRELDISAANTRGPEPHTFFYSRTPAKSGEQVQPGCDTYYVLHVQLEDGALPAPEDIAEVAELIGASFYGVSEKQYLVSVSYSKWDADAYEAGECAEQGWHTEDVLMDAVELARFARDLGISAASTRTPEQHTVFHNEVPAENREHFEQGIDTHYNLHIRTPAGTPPSPEDIAEVASAIGVRLEAPKPHSKLGM